MVSVSLSAVVPCQQYGNLQPTVTVDGETVSGALDVALGHVKEFWDKVGTKPLEIRGEGTASPSGKVMRCLVSGAEVLFDPVAHTYHDREGNRYTGGSTFAGRYKQPFAKDLIAGKVASKHGVEVDDVLGMWALNAEASSTVGTAVHAALQLRGEYEELSRKTKGGDVEAALTSNPILRPIVESFFTEERAAQKAFYECFIADASTRSCGLIDRLEVDDDGLRVTDYKTSITMDKPEKILPPFSDVVPNTTIGGYWLQLAFYGRILQTHGRTVKGLRIYHWDGSEWVVYDHDMIDLSPAFEGINQ